MSAKDQLEAIRTARLDPLPTPPKGWAVNWFEANDDTRCYAAIVTNQEGPGKVELVIFKPRHHAIHKQGVLHRSHPIHRQRHNTITMGNGTWDYLPGQNALKAHRELHLRELDKQEASVLQSEKIAQQIKANEQPAVT